ncbi:sperm flagellar protein 2 isoform X1 [Solea solea]|uniref:sperm flagellar protein 2 isoform X1 n=1 Tax=Solea solea TaxID=90069 RepID=UPI00272984CB|nr:sperm flagellar protein 2 isoform X1 [Solea solea]
MSDLLCRWLNELRLTKVVEPKTIAKEFSTGYLIGEVLHKYQLQNDFHLFTRKDTSISKVNNYTRLEPTIQLLGISFDVNTAQELMQEKQGVASRLLYQLYTALENKKKAEMTGTMMEIMQPAAIAGLHKKLHNKYTDRLHQVVKRDADMKLQKITQHYEETFQQLKNRAVPIHHIQQKSSLKVQNERTKNIEKLPRQKFIGIMSSNQAAPGQVPKPPPYTKQLHLKKRRLQQQQQQQQQHKERQAQTVHNEIYLFESNRKKLLTAGVPSSSSSLPIAGYVLTCGSGSSSGFEEHGSGSQFMLQPNSKYMQELRQKLEENAAARKQRDKRRDRFLVEQLRAHEAQEEAWRNEQLVKRLTRQTQQELRLATQLLQIRVQKEVIRQNRLFREQQYQQRRERDYQEALYREAALAQQVKLDHADEIRKEFEFFNKIVAERAQRKYQKHYNSCKDIVEQMLDLATKIGEFRLITENLIPEKLMREWKELYLSGFPLYEPIKDPLPGLESSTPVDPVDVKKQELLNNQEYDEYTNMVCDWTWPKEAGETKSPPTNNNILGHVIQRLRNIAYPIIEKPSTPPFPPFILKACVLGKFCCGKTTCLAKIAKAHGICFLSTDTLVEEMLNAYHNEEEMSTLAAKGAAAEEELKKGHGIPNELLVDIIVDAIRQVPPESGWILEGFPADITQAHLLEKALGGSVKVVKEMEKSRTDLVMDPDPPKPKPTPDPVLDLVLLLDIPDDVVIRRAFSHAVSANTDTAADTTHNPSDKNVYLAQIPHRITAFQDTWAKLEKWFGSKQNILVHVDANVDEEVLCQRVESVLQCYVMAEHKASITLPGEQPPPVSDNSAGLKDSSSSLKKNKMSPGRSEKTSPSSVTNGAHKDQAKSSSPHSLPPNWVYVDERLPPEIPAYLCSHWDKLCVSYVKGIKTVMQQLRSQTAVICHHLYNIREEFKHKLWRSDVKQEFVSEWQTNFNSISDDMREDEETKAELHLRLDELHERLRDISNKRKEQNEKERSSLMHSGWLEDHTAIIIRHHSAFIQVELGRFQETVSVLRVYYFSMRKEMLLEPPSNFVCIPLLGKSEVKDQSESLQFISKQPDSPGRVSKVQEQYHTELVKPTLEKFISDYDEAVGAITKLVLAETHQGDTKEQKEKPQDKEKEKATTDSGKKKKGKQSSKDQKVPGPPKSSLTPSPVESDGKRSDETFDKKVRNKSQKEYAAVLDHEENAAKVRIALVKGHGVANVKHLQSRAHKAFSDMDTWLKEYYHAEVKSINQLIEVARHHIETGARLHNELVLTFTDFYLNGDCLMVTSPPRLPHPPPLETSTPCTPTVTQLVSLYLQLRNIAPSGFMSSFEFSNLLRDITCVDMSRNPLPELWINLTERQLMEIVTPLTDQYELIDWRWFLLSAALPWPFPSLTQLLVVLQHFKAVDPENTGFIDREQYLQTDLWFARESVHPATDDPPEPLPFDRLSYLRKFFFQLFADHSVSPPQLDYVSMLQYFAADPVPRQAFIRALSVRVGQVLEQSTEGKLVKSMSSIKDDTELSRSQSVGVSEDILEGQRVSMPALLAVICHKITKTKDNKVRPPGCPSEKEHTEKLVDIFSGLGYEPEDSVLFSTLSQHPFIQSLMETSTHYQLVKIHEILLPDQGEGCIQDNNN